MSDDSLGGMIWYWAYDWWRRMDDLFPNPLISYFPRQVLWFDQIIVAGPWEPFHQDPTTPLIPDIEDWLWAHNQSGVQSQNHDLGNLAHGIDKNLPTLLIVPISHICFLFHTRTWNTNQRKIFLPYNGYLSTPRFSLASSFPRSSTEDVIRQCFPTISWTWTDSRPLASITNSIRTTSRIFQYVYFFFVLRRSMPFTLLADRKTLLILQ